MELVGRIVLGDVETVGDAGLIFKQGDAVDIVDLSGAVFARGLAGYSAEEIRAIAGHKSNEIEGLLGYKYLDEVVHRDDLVEL